MLARREKNSGRETDAGSLVRAVRGNRSGDRSRILAALVASVLLHLLIVSLVPVGWLKPEPTVRKEDRPFRVLLEEPEPPEVSEDFSLTNPEVPSNPPDEPRFFSDRDQQAAQETPTEEGDPGTPDIEGEEPEPTQNIVTGETEVLPEEIEEWLEETPEVLPELPESRPIPGFAEVEDEERTSPAVAPEAELSSENEVVIGVPVEGREDVPEEVVEEPTETAETAEPQPPSPRPRPTLSQLSRNPVGRREGAALRIDQVGIAAEFSEFGDYIARMLEVIVRQWHLLAWETLGSAETGTLVAISFTLDVNGTVGKVEVLQSTASLTATLICKDAISSRQPYGLWTKDMQEVLGGEQEVRIRFLYR